MVRLWYKDGDYMDVPRAHAFWYEQDPNWDHTDLRGAEERDKAEQEALEKEVAQ